jgi:hypothetical protein
MQRFQILFPTQMLAWLRKEAERRGCTVCEVIRQAIQERIDRK